MFCLHLQLIISRVGWQVRCITKLLYMPRRCIHHNDACTLKVVFLSGQLLQNLFDCLEQILADAHVRIHESGMDLVVEERAKAVRQVFAAPTSTFRSSSQQCSDTQVFDAYNV